MVLIALAFPQSASRQATLTPVNLGPSQTAQAETIATGVAGTVIAQAEAVTDTPEPTASSTTLPTETFTATASLTPTSTEPAEQQAVIPATTQIPTERAIETETTTATPTATPSHTSTATATETLTPSPSSTATATMTVSPSSTITDTPTRTPGPSQTPVPVVTVMRETYYARSSANLRACPRTTCDIMGQTASGTSLDVTGVTTGEAVNSGNAGWYRVNWRGQEAYIYSGLVSTSPLPTAAPAPVQQPQAPAQAPAAQQGQSTRRPANCDEARAMGLTAEQAAQWPHLDRDRDGVACYGD